MKGNDNGAKGHVSQNPNIQKIHDGSMQILEKTGMIFHHPDAIKVLKEHGIKTEGNRAFFTEKQIMKYVDMAPSNCKLIARDSKYNVDFGENRVYNAPSAGPTTIMDREGNKRPATLMDYVNMMKMYEYNPCYYINSGQMCVPTEIDAKHLSLAQHYVALLHTNKGIWTGSGTYAQMEAAIKLGCICFGANPDEIADKPCLMNGVNTDTPLQFDINMTETLFTYLKYKQPVFIAAASMAGTTSPVTLAGTLAVANAEVIAVVALSEMYSPGSPVLYGSQTAIADMSTCAIAIGSAEAALCYKYCAELARFYGLPSRGGGALTDAKALNAQAGYESMLTYYACKSNHINLILQSSGIMESYLCASFEKMVVDFEIINMVNRYLEDVEINEDTLPLDVIDEVGPGGQYLLEDHTLEFCRKETYIPMLSVRGPHSDSKTLFEKNIEKQINQMIASYQKPDIEPDTVKDMQKMLLKAGLDDDLIAYLSKY